MKNTLRFSRYGKPYHTDDGVADYKRDFAIQAKQQIKCDPEWLNGIPLMGPLLVGVTIYQKNRRRDGHNQMAAVFDALESAGIIQNDRQITSWFGETKQDRVAPRVEIMVSEKTLV